MGNYVVNKPVEFGSLKAVDLKPSDFKAAKTDLRDGNYLIMRVRRNQEFVNFAWFLRVVYVTTSKNGKQSRNFKYLCLGDREDLVQAKARALTVKYIAFIAKYNKIPSICNKSKKLFTAISDTGEHFIFCGFMDFCMSTIQLTEDQIHELHGYNYRNGKSIIVRPLLGVLVKERRTYTERRYYFPLTEYGTVSYHIIIGNVERLSLNTAQKAVEFIVTRLSQDTSYRCRKEICEEAIHDFFKIEFENREQLLPNSKTLEVFSSEVFAVPKKLYISDNAVDSIYQNYDKLFKSGFYDKLNNCNVSEKSWGLVFNQWYAMWSQTVCKSYHKYIFSMVEKYTQSLFDKDLKDIIENQLFNGIVMSVNMVNSNLARKLLNTLSVVLDYAVALNFIVYNPLTSLKTVVKKKPATPMKSLDPYNLKEEIRTLFREHISLMPTKHQIIFELLFYTLLRTSELLKIRKDQIVLSDNAQNDEDRVYGRLRTVANKTLKEFSIPLTDYAQKLIKLQLKIDNTESNYLFPGAKDHTSHVKNRTLHDVLHTTNCQMLTPHGIRSVGASFFAQHTSEISYEVGMACLQHSYASKVHMVYDRTFLYVPRQKAMQIWSDFLQDAIGAYSVCYKL